MNRALYACLIPLVLQGSATLAAVRQVPSEYGSIQRAIEDCNDGDTVIVHPGIYYETVNFGGRNITVTSKNPNDPKVVGYTIINADGEGSAVTFEQQETPQAMLIGLTITGGVGTLTSTLTSTIAGTRRQFRGAGIYCKSASPTITRNVITGNHGPHEITDEQIGNAIYRYWSKTSYGGGVGCSGGNPTITRNVIYGNSASYGGGISADAAEVAGNILYDNSAYSGGGIRMYYGRILNNTLVGNNCNKDIQYGQGGNIYCSPSWHTDLVIANNIITGAASGGGIFSYRQTYEGLIRFNDVWDNAPGNYAARDSVTGQTIYTEQVDRTGRFGNISEDPLFTDLRNKNFHLQEASPCVSAGDPSPLFVPGRWDIDGDPRVFALRVDMGADEFVGYVKPLANAGADQHVPTPAPVSLDGSGSYIADDGDATYEWSQTRGPAVELSDAAAARPVFTPPAEGWYTFELVVGDSRHTSGPDEVLVVVGNERPVANAGPDGLWPVGGRIVLDGSRSCDADPPDKLTYTWTQIQGPNVVLTEPNSATPYFGCTEAGIYVFELVVGDGFTTSEPDTMKLEAAPFVVRAEPFAVTDYEQGSFYYTDVAGSKIVCTGGAIGDFRLWAINCIDRETGKVDVFEGGAVDVLPRIDGGRIVWAGGANYGRICTSIFLGDLMTGAVLSLRQASTVDSYGYPAISGNRVVWARHLGVDTQDAARYKDSPYDICGVEITDPKRPVYFTIVERAGRGAPHPYDTGYIVAADVVDICGNLVVWEGNGDIYGADISDLNDIEIFPVCTAPQRQYDPAISGSVVVWTDRRHDVGDIYGADLSDPNHIREFEVWRGPGPQVQPDIDGPAVVFIDGDETTGSIRNCWLSRGYGVVRYSLPSYAYGSSPKIDGSTVVWQTGSRISGLSFEFAYSVTEGPIRNLNSGRYYDYIQHAIDAATDGDVILVEPGVYAEKVRLNGKNVTVTSADPEDPVVRATTVIGGSGQRVTFADGETADCTFTGFTVSSGSYGIFCGGSAPTITNCTITSNACAGVKLWNQSDPVFSHCEITGNGLGVEMWAHSDTRTILRNSGTFRNCLIAGSRRDGIYSGYPTLENCTVADNLGYGVNSLLAEITNSIIYFNHEGRENVRLQNARSTVTYSDVQGGWPGAGNIDADPQFVTQGFWTARAGPSVAPGPFPDTVWVAGDYHLKSQGWSWDAQQGQWMYDDATSPCIDTGDPAAPLGDEAPCGPGDPLSERAAPNTRINMGVYGGTDQASLAPHAATP